MQQARKNHYSDIGKQPYFLVIDEAIYLLESLPAKKEKGAIPEKERVLGLLRDISLRGRAAGVQLNYAQNKRLPGTSLGGPPERRKKGWE